MSDKHEQELVALWESVETTGTDVAAYIGRVLDEHADQLTSLSKPEKQATLTQSPPKAAASQGTYGCAALVMTNKLLAETVGFLHQNGMLLAKHREQLEEHRGRLAMLAHAQRMAEKRLDKHHDRLMVQRKRLDGIERRLGGTDGEVAKAFQQLADRLDALEQGRQTGMSAPPECQQATEKPKRIGQAWVFWGCDQWWWDTLEPGGDTAARNACYNRAIKLFEPSDPPRGKLVLVNLNRVPGWLLGPPENKQTSRGDAETQGKKTTGIEEC